MTEPVLTKEGQETLDAILNVRPPLIKERKRQKVFRALSLLMNEQGAKEAGRELVIEAARLVLPPSDNGQILMAENPDRLKKLSDIQELGAEAYYRATVGAKRWDIPEGKTIKRTPNMKVLAFCASPRVGGNTDILIDEALRGAQDAGARVEKVNLQKIKLGFCTNCCICREEGHEGFCVLKDDMSEMFPKILEANALIIGFSVYIGRECAQLAAFFDRWFCVNRTKLGTDKISMVIYTQGASLLDVYDHVAEKVIGILRHNGITTVEAITAGGFSGQRDPRRYCRGSEHGLDEEGKGVIRRSPKELEKAYQAGKALVTG